VTAAAVKLTSGHAEVRSVDATARATNQADVQLMLSSDRHTAGVSIHPGRQAAAACRLGATLDSRCH
jgi:hypothetical protein